MHTNNPTFRGSTVSCRTLEQPNHGPLHVKKLKDLTIGSTFQEFSATGLTGRSITILEAPFFTEDQWNIVCEIRTPHIAYKDIIALEGYGIIPYPQSETWEAENHLQYIQTN